MSEFLPKADPERAAFKSLDAACASGDARAARKGARDLARRVRTMIFMEEPYSSRTP